MSEINYNILDSFNKIEEMRDSWDEFIAENKGPVYMSFDWCCTWWKYYGDGKQLMIFISYQEDKIIGILPMYIESLGFFPLKLRVARLIGSNIPPKVLDPPVKKDWISGVFEILVKELILAKRCDVISFGPLSDTHPVFSILKDGAGRWSEIAGPVTEDSMGVYSYFLLPGTFEEYLQSLSNKERKKYTYESRYLKKNLNVESDVVKDQNNIENEFIKFEEMHTVQWKEEGRPGHFQAWPKAQDFNLELARTFARKGNLRLFRHTGEDRSVAYQYTFAFGETYYWQLPARTIDPKWRKFSLGSIGVIDMIKTAIDEGITRIEAGIGHYDYKIKLGAQEHPVSIVRLVANRLGSRLRFLVFRTLFSFINICYHKIWYRRLQPRLPAFFQRPIWKIWIDLSF
jgi:CelD/BcsL family acetyltransferase involved in cellulose biosynthesis